MDIKNDFAGVTLAWLYQSIEDRSKASNSSSHFKFIAARKIQTLYRGWIVRKKIVFLNEQATKIKKTWRGYVGRRLFYNILEETVQERMVAHYNKSATRIQSLWRGYWSRKRIHDFYKLKQLQIKAAMDLINCVAHKLHHMLRTHQIPGVYSIRNSHCLSKVEQLLASMRFKQYNDCVRKAREAYVNKIDDAICQSKVCKTSTKIPFGTPCQSLYREPDADRRMHDMLETYRQVKLTEKRKRQGKHPKPTPVQNESDFCTNVWDTMKRYGILNEQNQCDCANFNRGTSTNIEHFLDDINSVCESI